MSLNSVNTLVIGIGSNCGDRGKNIAEAVDWLNAHFSDVRVSDIYETPEWSGRFAPYLNGVVSAGTTLSLDAATGMLKGYERSAGRTPESKVTGEVPVDLDIVVFNGDILRPVDMTREYFLRGYRQLQGFSV